MANRMSLTPPWIALGALAFLVHGAALAAAPTPPPTVHAPAREVLLRDLEAFAKGSGGIVGVAAERLDGRGGRVELRSGEAFPMASTFKVAVAGAVLARVDRGEVTLEQLIDVDPSRMVASEVLEDRFIHPGVRLSVYNLLELMLTQSDNTATDLMTELAGGPQAVTAWLRKQGIEGQRVDRDTAGLLRDFFGLGPGVFHEVLERAVAADPSLEARGDRPNPAFDHDPRDTTTPAAMAALLGKVFRGEALSATSTAVLTGIMGRCRTGAARIRGLLPAGTAVAHKTGTIGGTVNDAGVVTLPGHAGAIVMAIYVKESAAPEADRERAIAEIARSIRDYYLYDADRAP